MGELATIIAGSVAMMVVIGTAIGNYLSYRRADRAIIVGDLQKEVATLREKVSALEKAHEHDQQVIDTLTRDNRALTTEKMSLMLELVEARSRRTRRTNP